jgi:hypothetical protein
MLTSRRPVIGIAPKGALAAAVSAVGAVLKVVKYAKTFGKLRRRYGFPSAIRIVGFPEATSCSISGPSR